MRICVYGIGVCVEGLRKRMMKVGKNEEKQMGPLFPRLHINDAEKGGPRAPPRNKMALYEQLSIPSQRFASGSASASMLPLPPNNSCNLIPSISSSHGGSREVSLCSPFYNTPASPHLAERLHSYSSGGVNFVTALTNLESQPKNPTNHQTSNATAHLSTASNCSLSKHHSFSSSKNSSAKKLGDGDDIRVPMFTQLEKTANCSNDWWNTDKEKLISSRINSSRKLSTACEKQMKWTTSADLKSSHHLKIVSEKNPEVSRVQDHGANPAAILSNGDQILADASSSPLARDRGSEQARGTHASLNRKRKSSLEDDSRRLNDSNAESHQDCRVLRENKILRDDVSVEPENAMEKGNASKLEGVSCPRPTLEDNNRSPHMIQNVSDLHEDRQGRSLQACDIDKGSEMSDTSMVDSISGLDISPDDVVGVIGQKQFWKARRAIVHQQRVFAVQVFELHRLIKVQRLIAGAPDLFLADNLYMRKSSIKASPVKKLQLENVLEAPPLTVKPTDDSQKPNPSPEYTVEKAVRNLSLPLLNNDTSKVHVSHPSNYEPYSRNTSSSSIATNAKAVPCFQAPPGNQWLVPVISPSEGLVYKPYAGPCPPTAGLLAPVYGNYGPLNLTPESGDFLNTVCCLPASHHQGTGTLASTNPLGHTYFPPYGVPLKKPSVSSSAVEQKSPITRARSKVQENQLSVGDINLTIPYKSSCTMSSHKSGVISYCVRKLNASKESELQGSTASSPPWREQGDPLPLFPTAPTVQVSDQPDSTHNAEQQTRVIKVVPHNPRSAFESAARIFQSIQEERKQY